MVLPSRYLSGAAQRQQLVEPLSCEAHVSLRSPSSTLLERVQDVNGFGELGDVQDLDAPMPYVHGFRGHRVRQWPSVSSQTAPSPVEPA
jgi:hypothetical protein